MVASYFTYTERIAHDGRKIHFTLRYSSVHLNYDCREEILVNLTLAKCNKLKARAVRTCRNARY